MKLELTKYPGIYRRGSRYVVRWQYRGRQYKEFFRTLAEAREAQGKRRQAGAKRVFTKQTFEQYATEWMETYRGRTVRGLSESTRRSYRKSIEGHAIPVLGRYRLSDVAPPDLRRLVQSMETKIRPASVRRYMAPIKALFATAFEDGAIGSNPAAGLRISGPREDHGEARKAKAMTREELRAVLAGIPDAWKPFFTLLAHTGLRISEAIAVSWADVDLGRTPTLHVRRQLYRGELKRLKSGHSVRDLPLSSAMARTLREMRARSYAGDDDAFVFTTPTGAPVNARNLARRVLDPTVDPLGLGWVSFHSFRHTCASLLFAAGKNVKQVQQWLGHADPGFTLRTYVHLIDEGLGTAEFLDVELAVPDAIPT